MAAAAAAAEDFTTPTNFDVDRQRQSGWQRDYKWWMQKNTLYNNQLKLKREMTGQHDNDTDDNISKIMMTVRQQRRDDREYVQNNQHSIVDKFINY